MKILTLSLLAGIGFLCPLGAQTTTAASENPEYTYQMFDDDIVPPSYPGGEAELMAFLGRTIQYPVLAKENNIQGVVVATFVVDKDGTVTDIQIISDIGGGCGDEILRVLQTMKPWLPGTLYGQPVKIRYTLPVRFKLEDEKPKKKKSRALFGN